MSHFYRITFFFSGFGNQGEVNVVVVVVVSLCHINCQYMHHIYTKDHVILLIKLQNDTFSVYRIKLPKISVVFVLLETFLLRYFW